MTGKAHEGRKGGARSVEGSNYKSRTWGFVRKVYMDISTVLFGEQSRSGSSRTFNRKRFSTVVLSVC